MDNEILNTVIVGAPNFVGFVMALVLLYRRLRNQDELIMALLRQIEDCEQDRERRRDIASETKPKNRE